MRIFSWNVNGIRAVLRKGDLQKFMLEMDPDILCLQETKAKKGQVEVDFEGYEEIWNSAERPGYSGTAIFSKVKPLSVNRELPVEHDFSDQYGDPLNEGRVLTAEFEQFYLVDVYAPNAKPDLSRLELRDQKWDPAMLHYLKELEKTKPVVVCGDFNVAHEEIDLARPASNRHSAGFTAEERKGIDNLIKSGLVDSFRALHPDEQRYTWWSHWAHARENNVGWRIDYFLVSKELEPKISDAEIYEKFTGSDHCPISVTLDI